MSAPREAWQFLDSVEEFEHRYGPYRGALSAADLGEILVLVGAMLDVSVRLICMRRLLDDGADPTVRVDSLTPLHTMFGAYEQDIPGEAEILAQVLDAGVDLNARERRGGTALSKLVGRYAIPEADLQPIYDVAFPWGEQPGPDGRPWVRIIGVRCFGRGRRSFRLIGRRVSNGVRVHS